MTRNAGQSLDLERYYWLDAQIRRARYPNATTLAEHFEISRKAASATIQRLQDDLRAPLEYDSSRKGYRYVDTAFRLPPFWLQEPTAAALLVAQDLLSRLLLSSPDPEDARVAERVAHLAGVPQKLKARLAFETLEHHPPSSDVFSKVLHALAHEQVLELSYGGKLNEETMLRRVEVRLLHNFAGNWYLFAHCRMREAIRMFALDRIRSIELLSERFDFPVDFDPQAFARQAFGVFKTGRIQQARIRFSPFISTWVRDQVWHPDQKVTHMPDGHLEMCLPYAGEGLDLIREIMKYGPEAEVLEPAELRVAVIRRLMQAIDRYAP